MNAPSLLSELKKAYEAAADPDKAEGMKSYMRHKFNFYGLQSPIRKEISTSVFRSWGPLPVSTAQELCYLCFAESENREVQYFVNDFMQPQAKKLDLSWIPVFEDLILQKSWWDTVDFLSPKLAGPIFKRFPEEAEQISGRWIESDNFWLQRSAILFQLDYGLGTRTDLLFDYILQRASSREFFVQKASGWALRQYGRKNPEAVREFIDENRAVLSALTIKEGSKYVFE